MSKQPKAIWTGFFDFQPYDIKNKAKNGAQYALYMLNRVMRMFEYENLPETITQFNAERLLLINGSCAGVKVDDKLYLMTGGLGGEPDAYYLPTIYTVSNPALNFSKSLEIGTECVLMKNDSMMMGLYPMFSRYATLLAENDITMFIASINTRIQTLISADDDVTKASADEYIKHIIDGDLGVIGSNAFMEGLKTQPYMNTSSNHITQIIELQQYLKAGWFNDIGLQANYNMKRESINSNEAQLNNDALFPLVDDMEACRVESWDNFNKMFNTNVKVKRSSVWEQTYEELVENISTHVENDGGVNDVKENTEPDDTKLDE